MIGILFEKRIVDDSGFSRTPDRPVELLGTRVRYLRSVKDNDRCTWARFLRRFYHNAGTRHRVAVPNGQIATAISN